MVQARCCVFLGWLKFRSVSDGTFPQNGKVINILRMSEMINAEVSHIYTELVFWLTGELLSQRQLPGLNTRWRQSSKPPCPQKSAHSSPAGFLLPPVTSELNSQLDVNFSPIIHLRHKALSLRALKLSTWLTLKILLTFASSTNDRCLELHQNLITESPHQCLAPNPSVVWLTTKLRIRLGHGNVPCSWDGCSASSGWNAAVRYPRVLRMLG